MKMNFMQRCASLLAAGAVIGVMSGCSRHGATADAGGHGQGDEAPKTAQITVFGERHEIFAEHRLVVAGTPTKFVTHVTDLKTLEPRREGSVGFQMRLGQEAPMEQVEKAPVRAGIYEAILTFPKAGEWSVALVVPTEEGEKTIAFPPVKVFASADEVAKATAPEAPTGISFLKEQQWKILAGTDEARKRKIVEQLRLPAMVAACPGTLAAVTPPLAGRLLLPPGKSMPLVGEKVEAGQTLALLQPSFSEMAARFVEAEGEVVRAKLALEQADLALKRIEKLAKAEAKSGRELQEAEFAVKTAQAKYDAALALQATYRQASSNLGAQTSGTRQPAIELRSPIAGTIINQSGAAVGEYIMPEKAVFTVLDAATVFIEAHVPEASVKRLGTTKAASYEVPGETGQFIPITGDGAGRLVFVGIQVDTATRTVPLIYEVKNPENRLRVGQSVNLFVETARVEDTLAIPSAAKGVTVSRVLEGRNSFDLVVRLTGPEGWRTEDIGDLLVDTPTGAKVPLKSLADLRKETGPNYISREQVERKIVVMCNVAGSDVTSVVNDCKKVVDPLVAGMSGYRVEYGGQFQSAAEAGRIIALLGIAVVLGIGFLLNLAFGSARDAALIMLNLPLALIGGVVGVFVSGGVLSVASLIGFITVFGIATRNGIMLVSHIKYLEEHEGVTDFREAVFRGAMERLAPILMTALAAGLALIPLALGGHKPGSEIQTPMAIVILFGLLTSMLLNMIVVPALYLRFGRPVGLD